MSFAKHIFTSMRGRGFQITYFDYFVWGDKAWYTILLLVK